MKGKHCLEQRWLPLPRCHCRRASERYVPPHTANANANRSVRQTQCRFVVMVVVIVVLPTAVRLGPNPNGSPMPSLLFSFSLPVRRPSIPFCFPFRHLHPSTGTTSSDRNLRIPSAIPCEARQSRPVRVNHRTHMLATELLHGSYD